MKHVKELCDPPTQLMLLSATIPSIAITELHLAFKLASVTFEVFYTLLQKKISQTISYRLSKPFKSISEL
ncbi:hypothetical protein BD414DRAFT_540276 [Trametes punicea]|nr:hypothetical protein BD414DRAFT_540276 [Trametes punicea]